MTKYSDAPFATFQNVAEEVRIPSTTALAMYRNSDAGAPKQNMRLDTVLTEQDAANVMAHLGVDVEKFMPELQYRMEYNRRMERQRNR